MAVIEPNSEIYLIKCPIELDNENQLNFASATTQHNYFKGLPKLSLTNATFQRKDGTIRWPGSMEDILEYNYCMYRNKSHGNKWFYAFVSDIQYVNDNMTAITIKTDTWQTWQFTLSWKKCFVEREHVNDDTFGKNLVEEGLETGEYVQNKYDMISYALPTGGGIEENVVVMQVTELPGISLPSACYKMYNGVASGCWLIGFEYSDTGLGYMNTVIKWYDNNSKADAILAIFIVPETIATFQEITRTVNNSTVKLMVPEASYAPALMKEYEFTMNNSLNGYTPKNKKVYAYPYNYLLLSNNNGETYTYRFERFNQTGSTSQTANSKPRFNVYGVLTQNCQIKGIPINYDSAYGIPESFMSWDYGGWDCGINGAKYPMISWTSDYYLNWQAQNGTYLTASTGVNAIAGIASAALKPLNPVTGGIAALNVASGIIDALHQQKVANMVPDQAKGNTASGDLNFSANQDRFSVRQMCVTYEFAKRIDDFFSAYGYRVNEYKLPNRTGRTNWNYVKTLGCNITGDMPQSDIEEIKEMFNNGVTIWHNPATYLDYSQSNNII